VVNKPDGTTYTDRKSKHSGEQAVELSNPNNNHDDGKFKHSTRRGAEAEANRMRRRGYEGSERLNVYYNDELRGWYVGEGWE
jgi:hypothetical protein